MDLVSIFTLGSTQGSLYKETLLYQLSQARRTLKVVSLLGRATNRFFGLIPSNSITFGIRSQFFSSSAPQIPPKTHP
jgi:hypothetical protein